MATGDAWDELMERLHRLFGDAVREAEPMSRHTTIGVGGPARVLVEPGTNRQVSALVRATAELGIARAVIGKGSNLIVRDAGFDGLVVKLGRNMSRVRVGARTVRAQAGASFARLSRNMTNMGRTGMEFGIGIPGTVGGVVRMNAGAFGGEVSKILRRVWVVDASGRVERLEAKQIDFSYRRTSIDPGAIVVEATFSCEPGEIDRPAYDWALGRKKTQPIDERTFGSTFVNPRGHYAARLIEGCGLKGKVIGGAKISTKHANFIVNPHGRATAADVEALIELMRRRVKEKYSVTLRTEVVVIGNR
jgi:UDP-N-acetylmuramate dehydrogenase